MSKRTDPKTGQVSQKLAKELARPRVASGVTSVKALVDTAGQIFGELEEAKAEIEEIKARYTKALEDLAVAADIESQPKDKGVALFGDVFIAEYGVVPNEKTWVADANARIKKLLTAEVFQKIARVTFTDAAQYIPGKMLKTLYTEARTGVRRVSFEKRVTKG